MLSWLTGFAGLELFFIVCAIVSAVVFVLRMGLIMLGGDHDMEHDVGTDVGGDMDHDGGGQGFRLFTVHGLNAFLLMFSLVGFALLRGSNVSEGWAIAGGMIAGIVTMMIFAKMTEWMMHLQSTGTVQINNAIGQLGKIYLRITPGGTGKIEVVVQNRLRIYDAVCEDKEAQIETGEPVEVVKVITGTVLVVKKA